MNINLYQTKNLAVITISMFTIERIQPATGLQVPMAHVCACLCV